MINQFNKSLRIQKIAALALLYLLLVPAFVLADAPAGYYTAVDMTSREVMRSTLHNTIDGHHRYPYSSSSTDTWDILEFADEDPLDSDRILDVYKNDSYIKHGAGNNDYNREHSWPKSYGFPSSGSTPYTDCHHLFLCNDSYNSRRSNLWFGNCSSGCSTAPADNYNGQSGVNRYSSVWETWDGRKGDVARAMFYMDVRYEGDSGEPQLVLTDDQLLIAKSQGDQGDQGEKATAYMGLLSVLLEWNEDDPVDAKERRRNDRVYSYQGNRNPFIDHPEWANMLFADGGFVISAAGDETPLAAAEIADVYPNPFNPNTTISFRVNEAGPVRLEIYALDGKLVRTLISENREVGPDQIMWNGRNNHGSQVGSGPYFCRLLSGGHSDTQKLLLLK